MQAPAQLELAAPVEEERPLPQIHPRPYQRRTVNELYQELRAGVRRVLLVAPTGAGKTVIATITVQDAVRMGCQVLFIVDRDELVRQTQRTFQRYLGKTRIGVIKAGYPEDRGAVVQVASRQTMERRAWWKVWMENRATVVIPDEAHETAFAEVVRKLIEQYAPGKPMPKAKAMIIGLTATPWRLSKREGLGDLFESLVAAPTLADLIRDGYLLRPVYQGMQEISLAAVEVTRTGEYDERQLSKVCNNLDAIADLFSNWLNLAAGRRTIIFCVDVAHAAAVAAYWRSQGHPAEHIEADTPPEERRRIYTGLRTGTIPTVTSVGVLIKGFDETSVECIGLARPTMSVANHHQMIGRGLRVHRPCVACDDQVPVDQDDPDQPTCRCGAVQPPEQITRWPTSCLILDQAGNVPRLGPPDMVTKYTMAKGRGGAPGAPPTKKCPRCKVIHPISATVCAPERGGCGYVWAARPREVATGVMRRIHAADATLEWYRRSARNAFKQGWSPNYASEDYRRHYGDYPPDDYHLNSVFSETTKTTMTRYLTYLKGVARGKLEKAAKKGQEFDPYAWVGDWFLKQFGRRVRWTRIEDVDESSTNSYGDQAASDAEHTSTRTLEAGRAG